MFINAAESTKHLENARLGDLVQVKVDRKVYKGLLCWIGMNIGDCSWMVGVEVSSETHIPSYAATDGTFQGQRLWFPFQQDTMCYLLPAEMVTLSSTFSLRKIFQQSWNYALNTNHDNDVKRISLIDNKFILGQHVRLGPEGYLGCVVWTGTLDNRDYVVVKMALPDVQWTRTRENLCDPADITHHKEVTGFNGDLVLVQTVDVKPLEHQLPIPRVEVLNQKCVRVPIGENRFETGIIRWMANCNLESRWKLNNVHRPTSWLSLQ